MSGFDVSTLAPKVDSFPLGGEASVCYRRPTLIDAYRVAGALHELKTGMVPNEDYEQFAIEIGASFYSHAPGVTIGEASVDDAPDPIAALRADPGGLVLLAELGELVLRKALQTLRDVEAVAVPTEDPPLPNSSSPSSDGG